MANILYGLNDNLVVARGVSTVDQNGHTVYLTSTAVVQLTLRVDDVLVPGETWPIAMTHIAGSNGDFQGNLKDTLTLPTSGIAVAQLIVDNGADQRGELAIDLNIQVRKS